MTATIAAPPLTISEADYMALIIDTALLLRWRVAHFRPAQTVKGWRTAMTGHPGWPDLSLARGGRVIVAEVKTQHGRLSVGQREWLAALGDVARVWRPADWPEVLAELRGAS